MKGGTIIWSGLVVSLALTAIGVSRTRVFGALVRGHDQFITHAADARVRYEPGAEDQADAIAAALEEAVQLVEEGHGIPFMEPFAVFVCATQQSLNSYVAAPADTPLRGTAVRGDVYISPSAFDWNGRDTHRASLAHELSHLHLAQRVGFLGRRTRIPQWFHEGLANIVAESGGEGLTNADAIAAIHEGRHFPPETTGPLLSRVRPQDWGISHPMFHRQSQMFVTFLRDTERGAFTTMVLDVLEVGELGAPLQAHYGRDARELWTEFVASL